MRFIIGWIVSLLVAVTLVAAGTPNSDIYFENKDKTFVSVHWINQQTKETFLIKGNIKPGLKFSLKSYLGHHFEIRQELDPDTGLCGGGADEKCDNIGYFEVTKQPSQGELRKRQSNSYG